MSKDVLPAAGDAASVAGVPVHGHALAGRGGLIVGLLFLVNTINFVDRQLPFILIGAIKADLKLTDTEIGLMAGLAFAVVYSFAALPLAQAADRWSPRWVLTLTLATWSAMTAVSGLAGSFGTLVLARLGVGASEAGCTPTAHALISRLVEGRHRALAIALFSLGVPIGSMLGLVLGGWINDVANWRTAFFVVGLPGLAIALVAWATLPRLPATRTATAPARFAGTVRRLFAMRSFRYMAAASACYACGSYAINVFAPAFLMRVHGLTTAQAGLRMGAVFGIGGLIGTFAGGILADRLARRDEAWRQRLPAIGQWLSLPLLIAAWLVRDPDLSVVLLTAGYLAGLTYFAPTFAAVQALVPDDARATAAAMMMFFLTLVGSSVGPLAVGWLSDELTARFGASALRYALCSMAVTIILSAVLFHLASRAFADDLRRHRGALPPS